MALDPQIALAVRAPQFDNQLANLGQMMQLQNAGNQNQLAQYTLAKARREDADDSAMRSLPPNSTLQDRVNKLNSLGRYEAAGKLEANALATTKTKGEISKQEADLMYQRLGIVGGALGPLAQNPTRAAVIATLQSLEGQGIKAPPIPLPDDDALLPVWVRQVSALTDKGLKALVAFAPKVDMTNLGGAVQPMNTNALAGPVGALAGAAAMPTTATPSALLADSRSRAQMGQAERHFQANQGNAAHFTNTVADDGTVQVNAFDKKGKLLNTTEPGGKTPSFLSNENVRERQLAAGLEKVKVPHLEVLNAYQRYEQIKGTGDNSQANQFLAQQLMQMSKTGQRVIPQKELERILGSGDLGNDWIGRGANMVSQMASGVRTPTIDRRLNELADAMAKASAERIGQEIQNTVARTPPGVDPSRVVGGKPAIYGRFIITPTGKVHTFGSSAEAQAKLNEASKVMGQ